MSQGANSEEAIKKLNNTNNAWQSLNKTTKSQITSSANLTDAENILTASIRTQSVAVTIAQKAMLMLKATKDALVSVGVELFLSAVTSAAINLWKTITNKRNVRYYTNAIYFVITNGANSSTTVPAGTYYIDYIVTNNA